MGEDEGMPTFKIVHDERLFEHNFSPFRLLLKGIFALRYTFLLKRWMTRRRVLNYEEK
jgi:hypothetical protein